MLCATRGKRLVKLEHFCKISDIRIDTILQPIEVYEIATRYHAKNHLMGNIPFDFNDAIYLDEKNHITNDITWMVRIILERNSFEGMNEMTIVISDRSKKVYCVLDHNGIPIKL